MSAFASALLALALAGPSDAHAEKFGLAWVDIISEDSGRWLNYDVPMLGATPGTVGMRFLYQVQPVWQLPVKNLYVGTSVSSQSLHYERSFSVDLGPGDLGWFSGIHTRLIMPQGAMAGLRWKTTRTRLALGVSATSPSTWARPSYKVWSVLPTLGVSLVLGKKEAPVYRGGPQDRIEMRMDQADPGAEAAPTDGATPGVLPTGDDLPEGAELAPAEPTGAALPDAGAAPTGAALPDAVPPPDAGALPAGTAAPEAGVPPTGVALPPASEEVLQPASEETVTAPTGPSQVEFGSPLQVELPSAEDDDDKPTAVELPSEPSPTQVIIGGDDSSQDVDNDDDGD